MEALNEIEAFLRRLSTTPGREKVQLRNVKLVLLRQLRSKRSQRIPTNILVGRNATLSFYNRITEHNETYTNGVCQGWAESTSPVGHHKRRHPLDPVLRCRGRHGKVNEYVAI